MLPPPRFGRRWELELSTAEPELAEIAARCYAALEVAARAPEAGGYEPEGTGKPERWVTFDDMLAMVARAIIRGDWLTAVARMSFSAGKYVSGSGREEGSAV